MGWLSYGDSFSPQDLNLIRTSLLANSYSSVKKILSLLPEGPPTAEFAAFWRSHQKEFIDLCGYVHDTKSLLAVGVPTDMLASALTEHQKEQLPFWQSDYCSHKSIKAEHVLQVVPGSFVIVRCPRCETVFKVVP